MVVTASHLLTKTIARLLLDVFQLTQLLYRKRWCVVPVR